MNPEAHRSFFPSVFIHVHLWLFWLSRGHVLDGFAPFAEAIAAEDGAGLDGMQLAGGALLQHHAMAGGERAGMDRRGGAHGFSEFEGFVALGRGHFHAQFAGGHVGEVFDDRTVHGHGRMGAGFNHVETGFAGIFGGETGNALDAEGQDAQGGQQDAFFKIFVVGGEGAAAFGHGQGGMIGRLGRAHGGHVGGLAGEQGGVGRGLDDHVAGELVQLRVLFFGEAK